MLGTEMISSGEPAPFRLKGIAALVGRDVTNRSPGRLVVGTIFRDQPVAVQRRSRTGKWVRIAPDLGMPGWVQAEVLCPT